jgi:hypothetical protein
MREMTAGRRAVAALLGVLAVAGLAACRADPTVAAYVDDVRITVAEVDEASAERLQALQAQSDEALAGFETQLAEQIGGDDGLTAEDAAGQLADAQAQEAERLDELAAAIPSYVVTLRVLTELAAARAEADGVEVPAPDQQAAADELGMAPDAAFVQLYGGFTTVVRALYASLEPAAPTEADQREIYDDLIDQGMTGSFEEAQQVLTVDRIGGSVALRNAITGAAAAAELHVNPRYQPVWEVPVPLGNVESALTVPLSDSAVTEERS